MKLKNNNKWLTNFKIAAAKLIIATEASEETRVPQAPPHRLAHNTPVTQRQPIRRPIVPSRRRRLGFPTWRNLNAVGLAVNIWLLLVLDLCCHVVIGQQRARFRIVAADGIIVVIVRHFWVCWIDFWRINSFFFFSESEEMQNWWEENYNIKFKPRSPRFVC